MDSPVARQPPRMPISCGLHERPELPPPKAFGCNALHSCSQLYLRPSGEAKPASRWVSAQAYVGSIPRQQLDHTLVDESERHFVQFPSEIIVPPSTIKVCPVINAAPGEARKSAAAATSHG